jgi:hypothetical protein
MSSRPLITPNLLSPLIDGESMAANITSRPTYINQLPGISYDLVWTGNPVGTIEVQVSNTYSQDALGNVTNAGSWNTLPTSAFSGTYPSPTGTASNGFLDLVGTQAAWVRLVYVAASGAGTLTVVPAAKVL